MSSVLAKDLAERICNEAWAVDSHSFNLDIAAALIDSALPKSDWIRAASNNFPPDHEEVWICALDKGKKAVFTAYRDDGGWYWDTEDGRTWVGEYFSEVTHWMKHSAPAAPSTDEKEGKRG